MTFYMNATRCCDLVMKGGITSGVLYPPAICRIAEKFFLVGIAGTSAGAIAACTAAAAEYRRRQFGDGRGFDLLEELPDQLVGEGCLKGLFRPDRPTRRAFNLAMDALDVDRSWLARRWWKVRFASAAIRYNRTLRPVLDNGFGLCTGMANGNRAKAGEIEPLSEWLAKTIDEIAGKQDSQPLTFGDLRHAQIPAPLATTMAGQEHRSIDLRAVTTCVSFGRPYMLPLEADRPGDRVFAFDPDEWSRLFPRYIVDYLVSVAHQIDAPSLKADGKLPFPVGDAMPVVVAARMSLSFPGLFSMVPLYAVNYHQAKPAMTKVWFTDGGVTSNLPIHTFDGLFPRWPTLAINLQYTDRDGQPARRTVGEDLVYMIARREDGTRDLWHTIGDAPAPLRNLTGFAGALFRSAQVWHDNAFLKLPGYRDRVVEIWLRPDEGGMNLTMPAPTIRALVDRGNDAGRRLCNRFADGDSTDKLSWQGHRWARLRSSLAGLAAYLHQFKEAADHPLPGDPTLDDLLADGYASLGYEFDEPQRSAARVAIEELLAYAASLQRTAVCEEAHEAAQSPFCRGPRPNVVIGTRAPL